MSATLIEDNRSLEELMRLGFAFLLVVGLMVGGTSCSRAPEYRTDVTIKDIMDAVVDPNADFIWDSVSSESSVGKGLVEKAPKTDEEWKEVRRHAIALMEATNALRIPGRPVARPGEKASDPRVEEQPDAIQTVINRDRDSWNKAADGLYDTAALIVKAVEAKNVDGILDAGDLIDKACETCHLKYWYPKQYDLLQKARPSASERGSK
jgi:hypothetical protein